MALSIINCDDPKNADFIIIGANFDRTSSFGKGSDKGPGAIIECLHTQIEFYERLSGNSPAIDRKISYLDLGEMNTLSPEEMVKKIKGALSKNINAFPIILGGEHSVTNGPINFFADRAKEITIVQIDAHADLREDDSDYNDKPWGKLAHCSVMKRAFDTGFNLVQVGLRAFSAEEKELFSQDKIKVFEWKGTEPSIQSIIDSIKTDQIYLTIDADGIDPSFMPATGTPVQGGLSWYYTLDLVSALCKKKRLVGADLVEVAPIPNSSLTEYGAAQIVYTIIGQLS
ncbi:MAG: agmatinase [bacterium]|nr:agmatinase [bacterium]